jgi:hypothetical protein
MKLIRIEHNLSRRQLTVFSLCWLAALGILGGLVLLRGGPLRVAVVAWTAAVALPAVGWPLPAALRIVYLGMAYAAFPVGLVVSHVILAVVYYLMLTPIGLVMRLVGHDPMRRRFDPRAESYWVERKPDEDVSRYFRQF